MKQFWKFLLRKSLPSDSLAKLIFAVIGLGDSSYQKFNFVAKRLHKRLLQLGGTAILPVGLCDDQHDLGIGGTLYSYLPSFWNKINELYPLPIGINPLPKSSKMTRWGVKKVEKIADYDKNIDIFSDFEETCNDGYAKVLVRNFLMKHVYCRILH